MSSDWALAGATAEGALGIVYVIRRDATRRWSIVQKLEGPASPGSEHHIFGFSVAIDGDAAIVGSPRFRKGGGEVHFFTRSADDVWRPTQPSSMSTSPKDGDGFGYVVAIDGAFAAVTTPEQENLQSAVFTYRFSQGSWLGPSELAMPEPTARFGADVAIDGGTLVVCAQFVAYAFDWMGDSWLYKQRLEPDFANDSFCSSLALEGDTLLISDTSEAVRVYTRVAGTWKAAETIAAPPEVDGSSRFGLPIGFCGDVAMVGSLGPGVVEAKVTFLRRSSAGFRPFGFSWQVLPDLFDINLACSGRSIAILDSLAGLESPGAVYFFDLLE